MNIIISTILVLSCVAFISSSSEVSESKLAIVKFPSHLKLDTSDKSPLKLSEFKNLLLATNGFSIQDSIEWDALKSTNTLSAPRVTILFLAHASNLQLESFKDKIPVIEDTTINFDYLTSNYNERFPDDNTVNTYEEVPENLESVFASLKKRCEVSNVPSVYVFKLTDAEDKVLVSKIDAVLNEFYSSCIRLRKSLSVYVLATNTPQRVKRAAKEKEVPLANNPVEAQPSQGNYTVGNKAVFYSDQYPAIFNLLFWTGLILALAVFGVSYTMLNMDPGLDTVIYRMTSQRIKKDQ